jgi:hypothetical protein
MGEGRSGTSRIASGTAPFSRPIYQINGALIVGYRFGQKKKN